MAIDIDYKKACLAILADCKTPEEWATAVAMIKGDNAGCLPDWWGREVIQAGLYERTLGETNLTIETPAPGEDINDFMCRDLR